MGQGGIAVEDLDQEPVDDRGRSEEGVITPGVSGGEAGRLDEIRAEGAGDPLPKLIEDARNPSMHSEASCTMRVRKNPWFTEASFVTTSKDLWRYQP